MTKDTVLGEFGRGKNLGGVVEVVLVRGHFAEIRRLWRELDEADGPRQSDIFYRLAKLGALRKPAQ
jgi:hypothetical protein